MYCVSKKKVITKRAQSGGRGGGEMEDFKTKNDFSQWVFMIIRFSLTRHFFMSKIPFLSSFEVQPAQVDFLPESHKDGPFLECSKDTFFP
jgi:hypothetical protein